MVALNHLRGVSPDRHALDYVWIKSALGEKLVTAVLARAIFAIFLEQLLGRVLKHLDEFVADDFSFCFGIGYAFEQREKTFARIHIFQADMKIFAENALDDFFLARTQQTVVHENAGELIADRLVQESGGHGRIHAAAQTEHDFLISDLFADACASLFDEGAHCPVHRAVADVIDEILQNLLPSRRVCDFGMKLQPVKLALWVLHRREVGALRSPRSAKSLRQRRHFIAMTVPDVDLRAESI